MICTLCVSTIVCITGFCFGVSPQECGRQAYDEISNVAIFEISVCIMPFSFTKWFCFDGWVWNGRWYGRSFFSLSSFYSWTISKAHTWIYEKINTKNDLKYKFNGFTFTLLSVVQ